LDVILDLHRCPGHDFHSGTQRAQEFFTDPAKREQAKLVWKRLAERFGSRRNVLLEILNEPTAEDSRTWDVIKDEMAAHIRRYAPHSTIVIGSNRWNHPREFAKLTPLPEDNVIYSFHFYSPILFTHQYAPWLSGEVFRERRSYPGSYSVSDTTDQRLPLETGVWNKERMRKELDEVIRFREQYHVPVACNEFGVYVGGADRTSQLSWMHDVLFVLQEHGIGYSYWNYKNLDFGLVSKNESRFDDMPQYQNPDRTDLELLEVLRLNHTVSAMRPNAPAVDTGSFAVPTLRSADLHRR
jgi:endoglucanase